MLLGGSSKEDITKVSTRERIVLGLGLRAVLMSDIVGNSLLRNKTKTILREEYAKCGMIA